MTFLQTIAPFVGAVALECVHWFQLREKLQLDRYQRLLRSKGYWIITVVMTVVGGFSALIYFGDRLTAGELLVAGAAFPTLLKKLVGGFIAKQQTKLGEPEKARPLEDYLAV